MLILRYRNNGTDIMVLISWHRRPSRSQDWTQKHGTCADITVPISQHWSLSRSLSRSQNLRTGAEISASESVTVTGLVSETHNQTWNAPEQTRIRHYNKNMQCWYYGAKTTVPILWCRYLSTGVHHGHETGLRSMGLVLISQHQNVSWSWDRTQNHGTSANITVPISRHRSLSRDRDWDRSR